jgi:rod shape determining protein RodA
MLSLQKFSSRNFDWQLFVAVVLLVCMGLAAIYSVDLSRGTNLLFFKKQLIAGAAGLILLLAAAAAKHTLWGYAAKWWYLASGILLLAVLFFGTTIRGTRGWFSFPGFSFQPVELAKVGVILMLAYIVARFGRRFERPLFFFGTGLVTFIPLVLVMLQPDLGSAAMIGIIWFGMIWLSGARRLHLLLFVACMAAVSVLAWFFLLQDYQKDRLLTFVDPQRDPLGSGYNITQSIIAVGAGQFYGRGLGFGSQSQLRFLPEAQTDFIFSVIGEELGLAGVLVMSGLFVVIFWRLLILIRKSNDDFVSAVAGGILILLFSQFITNIGANIGLMPITGVTLPFVSYGGSSLVVNMLLIGIAESMMEKRLHS